MSARVKIVVLGAGGNSLAIARHNPPTNGNPVGGTSDARSPRRHAGRP